MQSLALAQTAIQGIADQQRPNGGALIKIYNPKVEQQTE